MWTCSEHKAENWTWQIKLITTVALPFNSDWGLVALLSCIMSTKPGYVEPPSQYRPLYPLIWTLRGPLHPHLRWGHTSRGQITTHCPFVRSLGAQWDFLWPNTHNKSLSSADCTIKMLSQKTYLLLPVGSTMAIHANKNVDVLWPGLGSNMRLTLGKIGQCTLMLQQLSVSQQITHSNSNIFQWNLLMFMS